MGFERRRPGVIVWLERGSDNRINGSGRRRLVGHDTQFASAAAADRAQQFTQPCVHFQSKCSNFSKRALPVAIPHIRTIPAHGAGNH